jgi:biopolymer transport protein ExbB
MSQLLHQGGPVLLAIAAVSGLGWALIVYKWLELRAERAGGLGWADRAIDRLRTGDRPGALELCEGRDNAAGRLMREALRTEEPERRFFEQHIRPLLRSEAAGLRRHLPIVGAVGAVAPLLGLLGTVLGMIRTFEVLTVHGTVLERMAWGISTALITTQAGLIAALPILLLHRWLGARAGRRIETLTLYVKKVETIRCGG